MAPGKYKAVFMLTYLFVTLAQTEGRLTQSKRIRRQVCPEGTYQYEGGLCCLLCAAGQKLREHCTSQSFQTQCDICEVGTYRSQPNNFKNCETCTSCAQPLANLKVDTECTRFNNTVCRCKEAHFCTSGTTPCKTCAPCQVCGSEGVQVACSPESNTICNAKTEGTEDYTAKLISGILVPVLLLLLLAGGIGLFCWRKRKAGSKKISDSAPAEETVILNPMPAVDLTPYIPAIAEEIGWTEMRNIAMNSKVPPGIIESCMLSHPQDTLEQTIHLLRSWMEREGRDASTKLIQYLRQMNRKQKAEKVEEILRCGPK